MSVRKVLLQGRCKVVRLGGGQRAGATSSNGVAKATEVEVQSHGCRERTDLVQN